MRDLKDVSYIPLLTVRPAEMQALEELPEHDKNLMMPFFHLGPWTTAHHLSSSLTRIEEAYGERPCFVTLADPEINDGDRPVHRELAALRNPDNGYECWCKFIENQRGFVPTLQLSPRPPNENSHQKARDEIREQADNLYSLDRGLLVSLERRGFQLAESLAKIIAPITNQGEKICFLFDFGRLTEANFVEGETVVYASKVLRELPNARIAMSASSFPETFGGTSEQEILERIAFNNILPKIGERLIYSDRGSARAERQLGGGGAPLPRIDYPQRTLWEFFRSDEPADRHDAYFEQARKAMRSENWDANLRVWGTQMIERTALEDHSAIVSPKRATAARINIHLHRQLFYNDLKGMYDTDDDWSD